MTQRQLTYMRNVKNIRSSYLTVGEEKASPYDKSIYMYLSANRRF